MRIAVIGTGDIGGALALAFAEHHDVTVSGSRPGSASAARVVAESRGRIREAAPRESVAADLVVLAVPWLAVDDALRDLALDGKVLLIVTLPWIEGESLAVGTTTSGAEIIASKARGARVVQAFNTVSAANVHDPRAHGDAAAVFVASDDAAAKRVVMELARELGFQAVDAGPLQTARYTEPAAMLWTILAFDTGYGDAVAFRVLHGPR